MKINNLLKLNILLGLVLTSNLSFATEFSNDNNQYIIEPDLYASRTAAKKPIRKKISQYMANIDSQTTEKNFSDKILAKKISRILSEPSIIEADKIKNNIVETKGNFNILRVGESAQTLSTYSTTNNSNTIFPVVKNKRFGNYGIVLDSIVVKIPKELITKIDEIFTNYWGYLQLSSHTSSGLVFFRVSDNTLDNLLYLKSGLEKLKNVEWVTLEIFENLPTTN